MHYLLDGRQMKAVDCYTIDTIGIPSIVLMEKAATSVASVIQQECCTSDKILAVCGVGNNGGDGIAAARILAETGFDVSILLVGDENKATSQTKLELEIARNLDVIIFNNTDISEYNVIIDALFGIGLTREVSGTYKQIVDQINQCESRVYSVDIPSGIDAKSGAVLGVAVAADVTVTFSYVKIGLVLYPGAEYAGQILRKDIGFPKKALTAANPDCFSLEKKDIVKLPARLPYTNKGDYGRVLVVAGSKDVSGAAFLCAKSAYAAGAGLVKIVTPLENRVILQTMLPEAIIASYNPEQFSLEWFQMQLSFATAVVIGPGLSTGKTAGVMVKAVLEHTKLDAVLDADALTLLANDKDAKLYLNRKNLVLTPHLKEMSRLIDCSVGAIQKDIVKTAREYVKGKKLSLVLKDARTITADENRVCINQTGNSGMAVGGSGDVLSGIIVGFVAQKMPVFEAASLAVYLHGLAGDRAKRKKNAYSMLATDLITGLEEELKRR